MKIWVQRPPAPFVNTNLGLKNYKGFNFKEIVFISYYFF